jgi:hypothetical protein
VSIRASTAFFACVAVRCGTFGSAATAVFSAARVAAFVRFGEAIQPLLDWCLEHADDSGVRACVEAMIADVSPDP